MSPMDTVSRLSVRPAFDCAVFSSVNALPSTSSADGCPPLFGRFIGTTPLSDSSPACAWAVRQLPSPTGLPVSRQTPNEASRISCGKVPNVRGVRRPRRARRRLAMASASVWPSASEHCVGTRNEFFHGSIPSPPVPLSALRPRPRGRRRMTRGQDGSLLLSCAALSSAPSRRFIPAHAPDPNPPQSARFRFVTRCSRLPVVTCSLQYLYINHNTRYFFGEDASWWK